HPSSLIKSIQLSSTVVIAIHHRIFDCHPSLSIIESSIVIHHHPCIVCVIPSFDYHSSIVVSLSHLPSRTIHIYRIDYCLSLAALFRKCSLYVSANRCSCDPSFFVT